MKKLLIILAGVALGVFFVRLAIPTESSTPSTKTNSSIEDNGFVRSFLSRGVIQSIEPEQKAIVVETRIPLINAQKSILLYLTDYAKEGSLVPIGKIIESKDTEEYSPVTEASFEDITVGLEVSFHTFLGKNNEFRTRSLNMYTKEEENLTAETNYE